MWKIKVWRGGSTMRILSLAVNMAPALLLAPVCIDLKTDPVDVEGGKVLIDIG